MTHKGDCLELEFSQDSNFSAKLANSGTKLAVDLEECKCRFTTTTTTTTTTKFV